MMRRRYWVLLFLTATISIISILLMEVPTRRGVDYKVYTYKEPLYIKIMEFLDRDYRYREIVKEAVAGESSGDGKVRAIFNWVVQHVKHQPQGLPIVDDHPLNIVIRGYGGNDQLEDIFTILCTYGGFEAFYRGFYNGDGTAYHISFVRIGGKWYPFSAYSNIYADKDSRLLPVSEMLADDEVVAAFQNAIPAFRPEGFKDAVSKIEFKARSMRVMGQSPVGRLVYHLKRLLSGGAAKANI